MEEGKIEKNNNKKTIVIVLIIVGLILVGFGVYYFFLRPTDDGKSNGQGQTNGQNKPNNQGQTNNDSNDKIADYSSIVYMFKETRTYSFLPVMPIFLSSHNDDIVSYQVSDLKDADNSNIIYSYVVAYRDDYCDEADNCKIKVSEFNKETGLNVGNNIKKTEYVKGIITESGEEYYSVIAPSMGVDTEFSVENCKDNLDKDSKKLKMTCDIIKKPLTETLEEKLLGIGTYVYDVSETLKFEKFEYDKKLDTNVEFEEFRKTTIYNTNLFYTINDKEFSMRVSDNGLYINDKKVAEYPGNDTADMYVAANFAIICVPESGDLFNKFLYGIDENGELIKIINPYDNPNISIYSLHLDNGKIVADKYDYSDKDNPIYKKVEFVYANNQITIKEID